MCVSSLSVCVPVSSWGVLCVCVCVCVCARALVSSWGVCVFLCLAGVCVCV